MIGNEIHRIPSKWVISFIADYLRPTTSRGQGQTREEMSGGRKGRKERCTPLAKPSAAVLKGWLREQSEGQGQLPVDYFLLTFTLPEELERWPSSINAHSMPC